MPQTNALQLVSEKRDCLICPILLLSASRSSSAVLLYEVNVIPRFNFPAIFLERIIRSDFPDKSFQLYKPRHEDLQENQGCGSRKFSVEDLKPSYTSQLNNFHSTTVETSKFKQAPPRSGVSSVLPSRRSYHRISQTLVPFTSWIRIQQ